VPNAALGAAAFVLAATALYLVGRQRRLRADRARHDAEQRLDAVARLTGGVAHDFNNLMTVIQHAVGLVALHPALRGDSPSQRLLDQARESAAAGGAITRQLLAFSSQLDLKPEALELPAYFERTQPVLAGALAGHATLEVRLAPSLPRVWVDPALLVTALLNLVVNARDALLAPDTIEISARYASADDPPLPDGRPAVRIDVRDRGTGMAPEVLARAVEPFYSTKGPGRGSGLGLSVVDGFLRQSGGRFALASLAGVGTTATLWLPVAPVEP
jgi:signal transduction histidine kinase